MSKLKNLRTDNPKLVQTKELVSLEKLVAILALN
jgi:hypothetical protein